MVKLSQATLVVGTILATLVCVSLAKSKVLRISLYDYLNLRNANADSEGLTDSQIGKALLSIYFHSGTGLETIYGLLKKAVEDKSTDPKERHVFKQMLALADEDGKCPDDMIGVFHSVWVQMMDKFGNGLGRFYSYLRVFGSRRFRLCADQVSENFKPDSIEKPGLVHELNGLFRKLVRLPADSKDSELYPLLSNITNETLLRLTLDLTKPTGDKWSAEGEKAAISNDEARALRQALGSQCRQFIQEEPLASDLDKVNLARSSGAPLEYDPTLLVLTECYRLCLKWSREIF